LETRRDLLRVLLESVGSEEQAATSLESARGWAQVFFDGGIAFYSADGRVLAATSSDTDWQAMYTRTNPEDMFSLRVEPGANTTQVVLSLSTLPGAAIRAVEIVTLSGLGLSSILSNLDTEDDSSAYLVDTDGQIIYHSEADQVGRSFLDVPHTNEDSVSVSAPIALTGWKLIYEEGWQDSLSPMLQYSQVALLVLVPGLLIAIGAAWFGVKQIVRPLQRLEHRATELAWGNFTAIEEPVGGVEEVRRLQATLRQMASRIQSVQTGMHSYIAAVTQAQEEERARLARELHDQTIQSLVVLDHQEQMLKPYLNNEAPGGKLLAEIRTMIAQTIEDLRRIVRAMRPIYLEELGLVPALKMWVDDLNQNGKLTIHFEKRGTPRRMPAGHDIALYRIAQEALNNAWKHSDARQVWVSVAFEADSIVLNVRDDGKGFVAPRHAADLSQNGHFGIMGMYERVSLIGAHLQIQSEPGLGTTITVHAPLPPNHVEDG
jgi:signal transduction histidine kinase